ncbi:MAG: hypothetical protein HY064_08370 [Bacteroidetes bacterium]|nr:hypothetical protein [Bacteroidota bacterium]
MKFSIVTEAPRWYTLLCVLCGIAYALVLYFRDKRLSEVSRRLKIAMAILRGTVISILAFLLLSPLLKTIFREVQKPVIVIAQDASGSLLLGKDSAFNKKEFPEKLDALIAALSEKYDVQTYSFGDHFREKTDFSFKDKLTDFSTMFDELQTRYSDRNLGAVIVASDGIYNEGQSPVYAAEQIRAPVFSIALGDTTIRKDLVLTKVVHNRIAFLGNTFPLEVVVDAHRCNGSASTLTVSKGGQILFSQPVNINSDPFNTTIPIQLTATNAGMQHYVVALSVLDDESNIHNNAEDIFIDVLDSREKILIVGATPHPDMGALKESIESNDNYEVESYLLDDFDQPVSKYNLVILHSIPSDNAQGQKLLSDLAAAKIPVFYITGSLNRYQQFNALGTGVTINVNSSNANDCEAVPVNDFPLFNLSDEARNYIPRFPAVKTPFGNFQSKPSVIPLLKQKIGSLKTDYPLWVFSQQGDRKVSVFVGEGFWQWRLHDFADHQNHDIFNELIGKTVQYLSVRDDRSFFRVSVKNNFLENEPVLFDAEVYNQSYELINTSEVSIDIIDESGKRYQGIFTPTAHAYHYDARQWKVGQYKYEAKTKVGDKIYTQSGTFSVSPLLIETANSTADHQVLFDLCAKHNGTMVLPGEMQKLVEILNARDDIKPVIYNPKKLVDLINVWWIFALLLFLLSLEWFMRKRHGAY